MTEPSTPPIAVSFNSDDSDLAYRMIGALVDMALTGRGASIDQLEIAFLGLGEVIEAIAARGAIRSAELSQNGNGSTLHIYHSATSVAFEPGAREIAEAAFSHLNYGEGVVVLTSAAELDGADND